VTVNSLMTKYMREEGRRRDRIEELSPFLTAARNRHVTIASHVEGVGSRSGSFMICIKGISLLCSC
jgi:hypothetical protein